MDYRENPVRGGFSYEKLEKEAQEYLKNAGACFGTPIERLKHMNLPAVEFYRDKGVDLETEPLEISLCAQHNNGGLAIDHWWQTNVKGFFAVGEVAASHGVYRPGGTALNAGQVGSMRAAQYIAKTGKGMPEEETLFSDIAQKALVQMNRFAENVKSTESNVRKLHMHAAKSMSMCGAAIRNKEEIEAYCKKLPEVIESLSDRVKISSVKELKWAFRLRDELIAQFVYLSAMLDYISNGGKSRGSALYTDPNGTKPFAQLPDVFTFKMDDGSKGEWVQEVQYKGAYCQFEWRQVRPIPKEDDFFENVWRSYRENENVY